MNIPNIPTGLVIFATTYLSSRAVATALNLFFWFHNPDDWAAFVEAQPRLSILVRISRAWGIDWRKTLRLIRAMTATFRKQGVPFPEAEDPPPAVLVPPETPTSETKPMDPPAPLVDKGAP